MKKLCFMLLILMFSGALEAKTLKSSGSKPQWATKGAASMDAKRSNTTYHFMVVRNSGESLQQLQERKIKALGDYIMNENKIEGVEEIETENVQSNNSYSTIVYRDKTTNQKKTMTFYHKLVDEYWEYNGLNYQYFMLFAVSENGQTPVFDEFSSTTSYGAVPVVMSIIPGVGQMYKGSTAKGVCFLAGTAALAVGALYCDNQRADYKNKMKEQPKFAKNYNTKANNFETARNVCFGAAAALWVYNIVDAAIAKGNRKIVVRPNSDKGLSLNPMIATEGAGMTLAYKF